MYIDRRQLSSTELVEMGPYGLVRHPVYSCLLSAFFLVPKMVRTQVIYLIISEVAYTSHDNELVYLLCLDAGSPSLFCGTVTVYGTSSYLL